MRDLFELLWKDNSIVMRPPTCIHCVQSTMISQEIRYFQLSGSTKCEDNAIEVHMPPQGSTMNLNARSTIRLFYHFCLIDTTSMML